jgi:hypothetical protein
VSVEALLGSGAELLLEDGFSGNAFFFDKLLKLYTS